MSTHAPSSRYQSLDVLRGIAILGTLGTNIWIFTTPEGLIGYLTQSTAAGTPPGWHALELVLQQVAQGKFLGLLTLMFGIGLELQRRSALRKGRPWPGSYPWRAGLLFIDGVLHYLFVAEFDVLMGYAVTGLVVAYLLATSDRAQRRWLWAATSCHAAVLLLVTALVAYVDRGSSSGTLSPNPYADGSWWDLVRFRLDNAALFRVEPLFILALTTAMFLLGARLVRMGVLEASGQPLRRLLVRVGVAALVLDLSIGLAGGSAGVVFARYGTAPFVALGLLAFVIELSHTTQQAPARAGGTAWLAPVGRMALSAYVLWNLIASAFCYGWGLGVAARLGGPVRVPATIGVYVLVAALVVLFAHVWLRRFARGPVELAWVWAYTAIERRLPGSGAERPLNHVSRE